MDQLTNFRGPLCAQLADRRSKVVKETCVTLSILIRAMKDVELSDSAAKDLCQNVIYFVTQIFQTLPQTVKVISEAGQKGMREVVENSHDPGTVEWSPIPFEAG